MSDPLGNQSEQCLEPYLESYLAPTQVNQNACEICVPEEIVPPSSPFLPEAAMIEQKLLAAGVTPELLLRQWGLVLWSIRPKSGYVRIKVDAPTALNIPELTRWFEERLGQPVTLAQCDIRECCQKPCKGCLSGNPAKRAFWSPQFTP